MPDVTSTFLSVGIVFLIRGILRTGLRRNGRCRLGTSRARPEDIQGNQTLYLVEKHPALVDRFAVFIRNERQIRVVHKLGKNVGITRGAGTSEAELDGNVVLHDNFHPLCQSAHNVRADLGVYADLGYAFVFLHIFFAPIVSQTDICGGSHAEGAAVAGFIEAAAIFI